VPYDPNNLAEVQVELDDLRRHYDYESKLRRSIERDRGFLIFINIIMLVVIAYAQAPIIGIAWAVLQAIIGVRIWLDHRRREKRGWDAWRYEEV